MAKYKSLLVASPALVIGPFLVLAIFALSVFLVRSELIIANPEILIGVTYDLTLVTPIFYLLLIWRSAIPKITVVPVFVVGFLLASYLIPNDQRFHLDTIELFVLPLVELGVVVFILINVRKGIREIKTNRLYKSDFYDVLKLSAGNVLNNAAVGKILATEIAMLYYGLFKWRKGAPGNNQFTGYRENGIVAIFITLVFLVIAETFGLHLLLLKWNKAIAWIIFALSIYTSIQILGHTKALLCRFIEISTDALVLRYGLFGDAVIPFDMIKEVKPFTDELKDKNVKALKMLGGLENHNTIIVLNNDTTVESIYGIKKRCNKILLHVDNQNEFILQLKVKMNKHEK